MVSIKLINYLDINITFFKLDQPEPDPGTSAFLSLNSETSCDKKNKTYFYRNINVFTNQNNTFSTEFHSFLDWVKILNEWDEF